VERPAVRKPGLARRPLDRQANLEARAPRLAVDADAAAVLLDDARADGEAEAGPLPLRFGGEERLEDPPGAVGVMPGPVSTIATSTSPSSALVSIKISPRPSMA